MATKIKRCLYIGLGGTGARTLLETKKFFIDTYGEVPPSIGFLAIDTDNATFDNTTSILTSKTGKKITLDLSEQCAIQESDPQEIYVRYKSTVYNWLPQENSKSLQTLEYGAGQVRTNGRFALAVKYNEVEQAILAKKAAITDATAIDNHDYEIIDKKIDVNLIFSIGGGTGCGIFIDVAYLIKKCFKSTKYSLWPYAVLPDVFRSQIGPAQTTNVKSNAFGALCDIDYLMSLDESKKPLELKYNDSRTGRTSEITSPFNIMVLIDNQNDLGSSYNNINQLTSMLGLALVTTAGDFGANVSTPLDNAAVVRGDGTYNIGGKEAWACGMGMCQILFDGDLLGRIYSLKAARKLISTILNSTTDDINSLANAWIDHADVNIREDQGNDNTIDFILSARPKVNFTAETISNNAAPESDVDNYIDRNKGKLEEINDRTDALIEKVRKGLTKNLTDMLNQNYGVGTSLKFLDEIKRQLDIFLNEMTDELKKLKDKKVKDESKVKTNINDLKAAEDLGFLAFKRKEKIANAKEDLAISVNTLAVTSREIARREGAITVFTTLKSDIDKEIGRITTFKKSLETIESRISQEINEIQIRGEQAMAFVIQLHTEISKKLEVDSNSISVAELSKSIKKTKEKGIIDTLDLSVNDIWELMFNYTDRLPETTKWTSVTIDEILAQLPDVEYNRILEDSVKKSSPLISLDYRGFLKKDLVSIFTVGVPDSSTTILKKEEGNKRQFRTFVNVHDKADFTSTGNKNSIIVYRLTYAVPPFILRSITQYENEYNDAIKCCHFDAEIKSRMDKEGYSIYPREQDDDAMELWVKAFIFGKIANVSGSYLLETKNKELASAVTNFKYKLNNGHNRREEAYEEFKRIYPLIKNELSGYFDEIIHEKGGKEMKALYDDVKENYLDNYSAVNLIRSTLLSHGYEEINQLINRECEFVDQL